MGQDNKMFRNGKGMDGLVSRFEAKAGRTEAFVGFLRSSGVHKKGEALTVATVAARNEFGAGSTPERSFMRSTMNEQRKKLKRTLTKLAKKVIDGEMDEKKALTIAAMFLQNAFRNKIQEGVPPPNSPETIAQKKSDHTLIDTGQMRDSIDFEIRKGK